ncbi:MAG: hypothetical protein ACOYO1_09390 [Bacteroidales bacterium]
MRSLILIPLLFLSLLLGTNSVKAQDDNECKHGLGVAAGFTTGYGLSYRYIPKKFGGQLTFAPYMDKNRAMYSIGLTFLYRLVENESINLFLYQGNQYYYNKDKTTNPEDVNKYWNNGIGIGVEFIFQKRFSFNVMGGYAGYENFNSINFTAETALFFKF